MTVLVSDLQKAKSWYERVLPLVEIERNIKTAIKGAWYNLNGIELHLLESESMVEDSVGGRITGQHIGLYLGPIGKIRDRLYENGISATLAPENAFGQQALFVTDANLMTWEFTDINKRKSEMRLIQYPGTQPAQMNNIHLNRPSASKTESDWKVKPYKFAISSGNPIATAAGYACLQIGGSAADAAIATAAVLSVVEPFNGGLGGDFIAMLYEPGTDKYSVLNGSGRSPTNVKPLKNVDEIPLDGPLSAMSIPGTAAAWCKLHNAHGKLPWQLVLEPAIMLAAEGFLVNNRTAQVWESGAKRIANSKMSRSAKEEFLSIFAPVTLNDMRMTPRAGERFYNPTLGSTYQKLADGGCDWFYSTAAKEIASHVQHHGGYQGSPSLAPDWNEKMDDHAAWEEPLSTSFSAQNDKYKIYTSGGNSQAGSALMILNTLEGSLSDPTSDNDFEVFHKQISAKRAVFRETFRKSYSQEIIDNEETTKRMRKEIQDSLQKKIPVSMNVSFTEQSHDTEGFVVRDSNGLTLSVLQSIANPFGSGIVVPSLGIPIHNRGYGFSIDPTDEYYFAPSKRPWTTLSPYMVQRNDQFWMAASVKGGDRQPYAFTQVFLNLVHRKMEPQNALQYPRFRDKSHINENSVIQFDVPPYVPTDSNVTQIFSSFNKLQKELEIGGYTSEIYIPEEIEDSGFGVAQVLIDENSSENTKSVSHIIVASDLGRKPGLALIGEQASLARQVDFSMDPNLVHSRDLHILSSPFEQNILAKADILSAS